MLLKPAQIKPKLFEWRWNLCFLLFYPGWMCHMFMYMFGCYVAFTASLVCCFHSLIGIQTFRRALTALVDSCMETRGPYGGVTNSGRVWRNVLENKAWSLSLSHTQTNTQLVVEAQYHTCIQLPHTHIQEYKLSPSVLFKASSVCIWINLKKEETVMRSSHILGYRSGVQEIWQRVKVHTMRMKTRRYVEKINAPNCLWSQTACVATENAPVQIWQVETQRCLHE